MELNKYKLGELIEVCDERNSFGLKNFYGLNINKEFMPTVANTDGLDESKYKVVRKHRFVFSGMQTGRDNCIRISMYNGDEPIIVSPAYTKGLIGTPNEVKTVTERFVVMEALDQILTGSVFVISSLLFLLLNSKVSLCRYFWLSRIIGLETNLTISAQY